MRNGLPEQIAQCIHFAKQWFQIAIDLAGLGSLALIALLIWLFRRLRKDLSKWEQEADREREKQLYADLARSQAEHRAKLAEDSAARDRTDLDKLKGALAASADDVRKDLATAEVRLAATTEQIKSALETTAGGTEAFWSRVVDGRFSDYERLMAASIPILLFGNQKGGVGKSTLVTNVAAAFASRGERVLTVDLDYQGSRSSLMQLQLGQQDGEPESLIDALFNDVLDPNWQSLAIRHVSPALSYIPAFYTSSRLNEDWSIDGHFGRR